VSEYERRTGNMEKTKGIFKMTSKFNEKFQYVGASKQTEIAFRDYLKWCVKGNAPKAMQAEFDRVKKENKKIKPEDVFECEMVAVAKTDAELDELKKKLLPKRAVGTPISAEIAEEIKPEVAEDTKPETKKSNIIIKK